LIGYVRGARTDAVGVENRHAEFADGFERESDALGDSCQEWEERGFPEALVVDSGVPVLRVDFGDGLAGTCEVAGIYGPDLGG